MNGSYCSFTDTIGLLFVVVLTMKPISCAEVFAAILLFQETGLIVIFLPLQVNLPFQLSDLAMECLKVS